MGGLNGRKGHTLLTQLVASGEVPMSLTNYNYKVEQLHNKGAPVQWFSIDPAVTRPNGIAMLRRAPHPNAAVLYFEFMLGEAQDLMLKLNYVPTSKRIETPLNKMRLKFVDPKIAVDADGKWRSLYAEIITKQAK